MTSGEVSFTTAEEVEELPIVLYSGIILMVVVFAAIIAVRATKETSKEYISAEAGLPEMESENAVQSESSEQQEEWLDADGNPIIGND